MKISLARENQELKRRLEETEDLLSAIKSGRVDAFVTDKNKVYTLKSADYSYKMFLETMKEGALTLSSKGLITYCNKRFLNMAALPSKKVIGSSIFNFIVKEEQKEMAALIKQGFQAAVRREFLLKKPKGRPMPVLFTCNSFKNEKELGLCLLITDLTEQKNVENELRKVKANLEKLVEERTGELFKAKILLQTLLTKAPIGMAYFDTDLRYLIINERLAKINGISIEGHIVKTIKEILPDFFETAREVADKILKTGMPVEGKEFESQKQDLSGVKRYFNESWYPVKEKDGKIIGFGAIVEEITGKKFAEKMLKKQVNELEHFNQIATNRELRMIQLKKEINELCEKAGFPKRYVLPEERTLEIEK